MLNDLEKSLCKSVEKAFNTYETMTGEWLDHAPEHYLQNAIFSHIGKQNFELYLEATYKKIVRGEGRARLGRPPENQSTRYDLIVWNKTSRSMRAVIEVKRSWSMTKSLLRDAERVKAEKYAKTGYLIAYTEMKTKKGEGKLARRFENWARQLDLQWLTRSTRPLGEEGEWIAAFALFKRLSSN